MKSMNIILKTDEINWFFIKYWENWENDQWIGGKRQLLLENKWGCQPCNQIQ